MNYDRLILHRFATPYIDFSLRRGASRHYRFTFTGKPKQPSKAELRMQATKSTLEVPKGKRELKILMIHGYTQSGTLFSAKTKALHKLLIKALSPAPLNLHPTLVFPSGPHRLRPSDIPGYVPPEVPSQYYDENELDNWAWFRKDDASGSYRGLDEGMRRIASSIREAGGVDGVLGFSQGGCMASLVASALEHPHRTASPPLPTSTSTSTTSSASSSTTTPPGEQNVEEQKEQNEEEVKETTWLDDLRTANNNQPLKFSVIYSGFHATPSDLQWLFKPAIATPTLHFLGGLDTVVEEKRSVALVERCRDPMVLTHPGGHYVPVARDWVMQLAGWLRQRCIDAASEKTEESV